MKLFNDCIHGLLDIPDVYLIFIDTPVFQRLRNIKQLGATHWVYPTAVHHRFEHSLGTAYLGRLLMEHLRKEFPDEITDEDIMCVALAGLLHDIGHGPFSHVWDVRVVSMISNNSIKYKHELASIEVIDWMIKEYDLMPKLEMEGLNEDHIRVIKELIYGKLPGYPDKFYKEKDFKSFMYDIISNGHCELDVDKFDYLARDGKMLGTFSLESHTDLQRLIRLTTVFKSPNDGRYHLAWRNIAAMTVVNVFQVRHRLHRVAYKHKNSVGVEIMLSEALAKANKYFGFTDAYVETGKGDWKLDVPKYISWTDHIYHQILYSENDDLRESREILNRIENRQVYKFLKKVSKFQISVQMTELEASKHEECLKEIIGGMSGYSEEHDRAKAGVIIALCRYDFCMKDQNPMTKCIFVTKDGKRVEDNSTVLSSMFEPQQTHDLEIRLYSRCYPNDEKALEISREAFEQYVEMYK